MQNLQRLFEFSRDLLCTASLDGYFREINPAFRKVLGYTEEELTEVPFIELVHPADRAATLERLGHLNEGRDVLRFENRYRCKDGSYKWLAWVATPEVEEGLIYAVARDVTDTRQSLDDLMSDLPGMVYRCRDDDDWTMLFLSSGCRRLTGYPAEDLIDNRTVSYASIVHPDDRKRLQLEVGSAVGGGREFQFEYRIMTADGEEKTVWEKGRAINGGDGSGTLQGYIFDISERRRLQDEVNHLQRMESLGELTGGIAHDFNNLLTIMIGNLDLLKAHARTDARAAELADDALDAAWRGAELCQRLLAFGRRQMLAPELIRAGELLANMEKLIRRAIGGGIEVDFSLADDLPQVFVDPGQLENAILNLAINARDAMPDGGTLHILTDEFAASDEYAAAHPDVVAGEYVVVEVTDSGTGMAEETRDRAFEPFFTTKEQGKGTGLGLSMVYGFLKQSGGHARIYSEPGHGTSVKLFIPVSGQDDPALLETARLRTLDTLPRGDETVLVVEDDPAVRETVVTMLTELGYRVEEASSAASAHEHLANGGRPVDLLFTDVVMPGGVDGVALAKQAVADRPELKVLLTSGFSKHPVASSAQFMLLGKPYSKKKLAGAVRQVLDS